MEGREEDLGDLLDRIDELDGAEREAAVVAAFHMAQSLRVDAEQRVDLAAYCKFSAVIGFLLAQSPDPSDALFPLATAYLTACLPDAGLDDQRAYAADFLTNAFLFTGDFRLAAECGIEALVWSRRVGVESEIELLDILSFLAGVPADDDDPTLRALYEQTVRPTMDEPGWILAARSLLDESLGYTETGFAPLREDLRPLIEVEGGTLSAMAHRTLARTALRDGLLSDARVHVDEAIRQMDAGDAAWLEAPVRGLSARIHVAAGDDERGLADALRGWGDALRAQLWCRNDLSRRASEKLAAEAVDVAFDIACRRRDWRLLTELIENTRLQAAAGAGEDPMAIEDPDLPNWIVDRIDEIIDQGAIRAGLQAALFGTSRSSLGHQVVASCAGVSALADVVPDAVRDGTIRQVDTFLGLEPVFERGGVAWWATVRGGLLYWTLTDGDGPFDGGTFDIGETRAATSLRALADLWADQHDDEDEQLLPEFDVAVALADAGSLAGAELLGPIADLIPPYIRMVGRSRVGDEPLPVALALPPILSFVPLAILPFEPDGPRLIEGVELVLATTAAVRAASPSPNPLPAPMTVLVSCSNPGGDLRPSRAVRARVTLDGTETPVSVDAFEIALRSLDTHDGVLFVRSHSGTETAFALVADRGIVFEDGVVSARILANGRNQGLRMPRRVVLALCSGAGSSDAAGLALGLAAACRLLGAEEVITSTFDVIDSVWSCELDERLAAAAVRGEPLSTSLRRVQMEALVEWKTRSVLFGDRDPTDGPVPLVWASYGVFV